MRTGILLIFSVIFISTTACEKFHQPKPKALLSLKFPQPKYLEVLDSFPFSFQYNEISELKSSSKSAPDLYYPKMKATLYMSYIPVKDNIDSLLNDAYQLPGKHMIKADEIPEKIFLDEHQKVYGTLFSVVGNAASQLQFFLTDSTEHFLVGSLYFYIRPNYDSIMPAAKYVERDVIHLMESLKWRD